MAVIAPALKDALQAVGRADDGAVDLGWTALALSAAVRGLDAVGPQERHLAALADGVAGFTRGAPDSLDLRAEALARILGAHYGYGSEAMDGDGNSDGGEAEAACLMSAIDNRRGSGLVLGLLYLATARACGWDVDGLDFPGRFLVRLQDGAERLILDPLAGGRVLAPHEMRALLKEAAGADAELIPAHYRPMENRALLFRYHNDLKMRLLKEGRLEDALRAVEAMLLAAPAAAQLWREAGLMHAKMDNVPAAVIALEQYLTVAQEDENRYKASQLLQELRQRLPS